MSDRLGKNKPHESPDQERRIPAELVYPGSPIWNRIEQDIRKDKPAETSESVRANASIAAGGVSGNVGGVETDPKEGVLGRCLTLGEVEREVRAWQKWTLDNLQQVLIGMATRDWDSYEANHEIAARVQAIMRQVKAKALCPNTNLPGDLRHIRAGGAKHGTFAIQVKQGDRRNYSFSSTVFPLITLVSEES